MKKHLIKIMTCCAACAALTAQAQTAPGTPDPSGTPGTSSSESSPGSTQYKNRLGATGRMSHQELRGSKLMGADIKTSQSESIGKVEDIVVSPASGRIDFAIISYNGSTGTSTTPGATSTATSSTGEKLIPVPWSMLRPQGMTGYNATPGAAATSSTGDQTTFVFTGDKSRLDNAPSFDRNNWPDLTQSDWKQRISSHFGSATGGATTPGGEGTGTSTEPPSTPATPPTSTPDSTNPTPKP
jgi:sporulation protein YlmC with PRC-barrel domain